MSFSNVAKTELNFHAVSEVSEVIGDQGLILGLKAHMTLDL